MQLFHRREHRVRRENKRLFFARSAHSAVINVVAAVKMLKDLIALVIVRKSDDVVLAEVGAALNFKKHERIRAFVGDAMGLRLSNMDGFARL